MSSQHYQPIFSTNGVSPEVPIPPLPPGTHQGGNYPTQFDKPQFTDAHNGHHIKPKVERNWVSWKLRGYSLGGFLAVQLGLLAAIIAMLVASIKNNGLATLNSSVSLNLPGFIPQSIVKSIDANLKSSYIWTIPPIFISSIYRICWDGIIGALIERQPFVELARNNGKGARLSKSIMLDYRSMFQIFAIPKAFKNRHIVVAFAMIWSLILSLGITPISSRLFDSHDITISYPVDVNVFDTYDSDRFSEASDISYVFDNVVAISLYGANNVPFTNTTHAFQSFAVVGNATNRTNLQSSAEVTSYHASLDCQFVTDLSWSVLDSNPSDTVAQYHFTFNDRDCDIDMLTTVTTTDSIIVRTDRFINCASHRIVVAYGTGTYLTTSPGALVNNITLLSCIPDYSFTNGTLTMVFSPDQSPQIVSFAPRISYSLYGSTFRTPYEEWLVDLTDYDVKATAALNANRFGHVIYNYAKRLSPEDPMSMDAMLASTQTMFSAIYAVTAKQVLLQPAPTPILASGTASKSTTRLFVNPAIAYVLIVVVALLCAWNIFLMIYKPRADIDEEPQGVLYLADMLYGRDINELVQSFRLHMDEYKGKFGEYVEKSYDVKESRAKVVKSSSGNGYEIQLALQTPAERPAKTSWWKKFGQMFC
ncbi:hypothetical protein H072_6508 [Dactylellina haptotyla CBS 200.50]|uniref:Uncharacterized protein n=1 Tax=Dactylellina haptotyla (strain CBS 200.50) TaxID=1284197 RepID=S8A9J3_DACHA|nr:hypothetical protein H072_6508 [Dactylellina haptotyla CBS 200.50]